jgi:excisionase family DNA binding protein
MEMADQLLTIRDVAAHTGLPLSWLYAQTAANTIPHLKIGKYVRFRLGEMEAWLEQQRRGPRVERPA